MTPEHGDYVARIEELTRRTQASLSSQPTSAVAGKTPSAATSVAADLQADPAEHGLGALHARASGRYAPPEERRQVIVKVKRSRWVRLLAAVGILLAGLVACMLYVGLTDAGERDRGFDVLFTLTWIVPIVGWFALRHRTLGQAEVKGYPLHTLAVMDLGLGEPCITLRVAEEDMIVVDTIWLASGQEAEQVEVLASEDLIMQIDCLLIRARAPAATTGEDSHSKQALMMLQKALAAQLCLSGDRLPILSPIVSANLDDGLVSALDYAEIIIKGGQRIDTDVVCDAITAAMAEVQQHYTVELDN